MLNYKEIINLNKSLNEDEKFHPELPEVLDEAIKSNMWTKALSASLMIKVNTVAKKVKTEKETNDKLDSLSDLIKYSAVLTNLNIATSAGDRSIYKKK